jgi:hypothetical protein
MRLANIAYCKNYITVFYLIKSRRGKLILLKRKIRDYDRWHMVNAAKPADSGRP